MDELNAAVFSLEEKQTQHAIALKEQFKVTYSSLNPLNIIKKTFNDLVSTPDFKEGLLTTSISMIAGYLSKRIAIGSTNNVFKQILGRFLQMGVTSVVAKNADGIRTKISDIITVLFEKKPT